MFCKHCGHKLTPGETLCPGCGTEIDPAAFGVQNFKVQLPSHEKELQALLEKADAKRQNETETVPDDLPTEFIDIASGSAIDDASAAQTDAPAANEPLPKTPDAPAPQPFLDLASETPAAPIAPVVRPAPYHAPQETAAARRSRHVLTAVVCVCMAVMLALVALRLKTHLFDASNSGLEPVSINVLTDEEKGAVLSCLSAYAPLFDSRFSPQEMGVGAFFDALDLNEEPNLYSAAFGRLQRVTGQADPLGRFSTEDGGYSYYRIAESDLNALAQRFGVSLPGSGNNSAYYYYDGAYYFFAAEGMTGGALSLNVSKAQRTEDGNYYIVLANRQETPVVYAIVSQGAAADAAEAPAETADAAWTVLELSNEPLFRDDGTRIVAETAAPAYEMRHEVIAAKTANGTLYANYVLDYPYFTDTETETAKTINALYAQMLASYKELAQNAEENYQKYLKREYDTKLLPSYTYMVSTVTYNEKGTVSLLDELTEYSAETAAKELKSQQESTEPAETEVSASGFVMPTITYSGTTIDTSSGAFLRRDDIFSGDFERYQFLLYHLFAGADEATLEDLLSGTQETEETTTENYFDLSDETDATDASDATTEAASALSALNDTEAAIGQQIYASPWVLTKDGVRFCYLGNGYYTYVTLPYSFVETED